MKKHLLSLAAVAAIAPAFTALAESQTPTLTEVWKFKTTEINDDWDGNNPNWSSEDAIKRKPCPRFATGRDGVLYTINMTTMAIDAVTEDGFKQAYKLPSLEGRKFKIRRNNDDIEIPDYYGTAISMDDAGNFLIGHYFTKPELSSRIWSVFQPSTGDIKHFDLDYPIGANGYPIKPEDYLDGSITTAFGLGRIDCVGRVAGDFTNEAIFFIAPQGQNGPSAQNIRMAYAFGAGDGTLKDTDLSADNYIGTYLGCTSPTNIVHPCIDNFSQLDENPDYFNYYIMNSSNGSEWDMIGCGWQSAVRPACEAVQAAIREKAPSENNGFDTFVLNDKRYFIHGYSSNLQMNPMPMGICIYNEAGEIVATWEPDNYASSAGYNSITAQPLEDGTALIHIYMATGSTNVNGIKDGPGCIAAAVLKFEPVGSAGISDIKIDSTDTPAVYYNLQGVRVDNPTNGIYVVSRGSKTNKEFIR